MIEYQGPYYPLPEASKLLKLSNTELKYEIETGAINAVVYTKNRKMLLLQIKEVGDWVGYATCYYRGHYTLHKSFILRLLDNEEINIATNFGRLADHSGVSCLSNQYPFRMPPPHPPIHKWSVRETDTLRNNLNKLLATPFPKEYQSPRKTLVDTTLTILRAFDKEGALKEANTSSHEGPDFILNFKENSLFSPRDLRIPASEIKKFQSAQNLQAQEQQLLQRVEASTPRSSGQRENQLHTLIERILIKYPAASAKEAWRFIEQEVQSDSPIFDTDQILRLVDSDCIEWCSRHGAERSLSWKAFGPQLSKIRKRLAASVE